LLISGQTHTRIAAAQREQVADLDKFFPNLIEHVGIGYGIPDKFGIEGYESSQRTRAFIHVTLGVVASLMSGLGTLYLFENGFGALNLPCDDAQIGSQNSRGTHPVFLQRMSSFISAVFAKSFTIKNPYSFMTKAQMLATPDMNGFENLFQKSFSCDRYPNYPYKAPQCGLCSSCMIRRMSMYAANRPDEGRNYTVDVFKAKKTEHMREREILAHAKLSVQANALAAHLASEKSWEKLTVMCPDILRAEIELGSPNFQFAVLALLRQHVKEWELFVKAIEPDLLVLAA
jgi:hypothetical protein